MKNQVEDMVGGGKSQGPNTRATLGQSDRYPYCTTRTLGSRNRKDVCFHLIHCFKRILANQGRARLARNLILMKGSGGRYHGMEWPSGGEISEGMKPRSTVDKSHGATTL